MTESKFELLISDTLCPIPLQVIESLKPVQPHEWKLTINIHTPVEIPGETTSCCWCCCVSPKTKYQTQSIQTTLPIVFDAIISIYKLQQILMDRISEYWSRNDDVYFYFCKPSTGIYGNLCAFRGSHILKEKAKNDTYTFLLIHGVNVVRIYPCVQISIYKHSK